MNSIFEYDNYRLYLKEYYDEQKEKHAYFSYQYLADKAGFKSKSFLYRIIMQERRMSSSSTIKISKALKHNRGEAEFFENLVGYNQARTEEEKEHYFGKLIVVSQHQKKLPKLALIRPDQYGLYSTWYHQSIRSLVDLYTFDGDFHWLAKMVQPNITVTQATRSIELLHRLGLIEENENGVFHSTEKTITTGAQVQKHALRSYYRSCMDLAANSMTGVSQEQRNISGLTVGVSQKTYNKMVERLAEVRREFAEMAVNDSEADRVYNMNIQLYPVSDVDQDRLK